MKDELESVFGSSNTIEYWSIDYPHKELPQADVYFIDEADKVAAAIQVEFDDKIKNDSPLYGCYTCQANLFIGLLQH